MDALTVAGGVVLITLGLLDVFLVVLQYDSLGLLANRLYRLTWLAARTVTAPLPSRARNVARSMVAPALIPLTLCLWIGLEIAGFALVYEPAMRDGQFVVGPRLGGSVMAALTFSVTTISSLGFGDLEPRTLGLHLVAGAETLIGLGVLTLSVAYVLNVYRVLQDQGALASALYHQAADPIRGRSILPHHFPDGSAREISSLLREAHRELTSLHEGLRRYPVLYYFQSRRPYRSLPYVFRMLSGLLAALRWGLPHDHPITMDPWLPPLLDGYMAILRDIEHHFVHPDPPRTEETAVDRDRFDASRPDPDRDDASPEAFLALEVYMRDLAGFGDPPDGDERYRRYCEWSRFAAESGRFVAAVNLDLGTGPDHLEHHPSRRG